MLGLGSVVVSIDGQRSNRHWGFFVVLSGLAPAFVCPCGMDMSRTTVVLDPPATGIAPRALELLVATAPSEILYVSCNPATLARDLGALHSAYTLESVTPIDMFPQTAEIEVLAVLRVS